MNGPKLAAAMWSNAKAKDSWLSSNEQMSWQVCFRQQGKRHARSIMADDGGGVVDGIWLDSMGVLSTSMIIGREI